MKSKKVKRRLPIEVSFQVRSDDALRWVLKKLPQKLRPMHGLKDLRVGMVPPSLNVAKAGRAWQ